MARTESIDALDGDVELGSKGVTGTVRGAMYDWGYSWLLTRQTPSADPNAPGGHSSQLAGVMPETAGSSPVCSAHLWL